MIIYCTSGATISAPIVDIDTTSSIFSMAPKPAWTPVSSATNSVKWGLIQMCSLIGFAVKKINVSCSSKLFLCSYCMNIAWWWSQVFNYYASPPAPPPPPPPTWIEYLTLESGGGVFYSSSWTSICMIIPSASVKPAMLLLDTWKRYFTFNFIRTATIYPFP